jgi:hypothetical protein
MNKIKNITIFKGKKAKSGPVHTMNITIGDLVKVFIPKTFHDKYTYIGSVPWNEEGAIFKAMEPLIIFMDYKMRPKWCPKWFLRFLYLFGNDNSIVRVRNWKLNRLFNKITKGYQLTDYKTKWEWYDLRISVRACEQVQDLASMIESTYYRKGKKQDLIEDIKSIEKDFDSGFMSLNDLQEYYDDLIDKNKLPID